MRNRTQPRDDDLRSQTYIHAWRHTYMLRHLRHTYMLTGVRHTYTLRDFKKTIRPVCLSVYVSFSMTGRGFSNIHAYANQHFLILSMMIKRVCLSVYVSLSMTGRWFSNIHTCSAHILNYQKHSFRACMFERVCLVFDDRQRVFKHTYMLISLIVDRIVADFA